MAPMLTRVKEQLQDWCPHHLLHPLYGLQAMQGQKPNGDSKDGLQQNKRSRSEISVGSSSMQVKLGLRAHVELVLP
ncbi:hypothetical protein L6164_032506 [Bauhinia variegata]|uniref:Uncharacterized protein n=1 Tax=Bauhinia variegata TaxID=167791 RepID=A0ACB9KP31_BAUVA|nr:hypothetical protein L6164_032506 [Bauhinia variegata]